MTLNDLRNYNLHLPIVMSFHLLSQLPRLAASERKSVANRLTDTKNINTLFAHSISAEIASNVHTYTYVYIYI